jgi:hypothetical protein
MSHFWTEEDLNTSYRLGYSDYLTKQASLMDLVGNLSTSYSALQNVPEFLAAASAGHVGLNSAILGARKFFPKLRKGIFRQSMSSKPMKPWQKEVLNFTTGSEFTGPAQRAEKIKALVSQKPKVSIADKIKGVGVRGALEYASFTNPFIGAVNAAVTARSLASKSSLGKAIMANEVKRGMQKGPANKFVSGAKKILISPNFGSLQDKGAEIAKALPNNKSIKSTSEFNPTSVEFPTKTKAIRLQKTPELVM